MQGACFYGNLSKHWAEKVKLQRFKNCASAKSPQYVSLLGFVHNPDWHRQFECMTRVALTSLNPKSEAPTVQTAQTVLCTTKEVEDLRREGMYAGASSTDLPLYRLWAASVTMAPT